MKVWVVNVEACRCCYWLWDGPIAVCASESAATAALIEWAGGVDEWADETGQRKLYKGEFDSSQALEDAWDAELESGRLDSHVSEGGPGLYWEAPEWYGYVPTEKKVYTSRSHVVASVIPFDVRV